MAAVDESQVNRAESKFTISGEELVAAQPIVRDQFMNAEAGEVADNLLGIVPLRCASDGLERSVGQDRIRRIDEAQTSRRVVLEGKCQAHDAEAESGADYHNMLWAQGAHYRVVKESEAKVKVCVRLVVTERSCVMKNVSYQSCVEAEHVRRAFRSWPWSGPAFASR